MTISFLMLGKFFSIDFSNIFSDPFSLSFSSEEKKKKSVFNVVLEIS